ncbi:MAG: transcription antitermination factor NusB [Pseudomonadota bacterium]
MAEPSQNTKAKARDTKPANKRGAARLAAVQALYQMDLTLASASEVVGEYENLRLGQEVDGDKYVDADVAWFRGLVAGVVKEQKKIDPVIHDALTPHWPLSRIDTLLRAILRAGVFELTNRKDVPARVIINEYVDVAHAFYGDDEPRMVNGVLDTVARQLRADETNTGTRKSGGSLAPDE